MKIKIISREKLQELKIILLTALVFISIVILRNSVVATNKIAACVSFSLLTICILQFSIKKFYNSKNLYKKIAWISEKEPKNFYPMGITLRDFELIDYIQDEQNILNIPKQYCINFSDDTEKNNLITVLNSHKERVVKSYFLNMLTESDEIYRLENTEYYFYSLYCYISDILCEYRPSYDIYQNIEYTSDCTFKCQLSDVGRVYYKLQLITQLYIGNSKKIRDPYGNGIDYRINNIKEHLDKNEVVFIHHGL